MNDSKETLIDVCYNESGILCKKVRHTNGVVELVPVGKHTDPFKDTETVPQDWKQADTEILEKKGLNREDHYERSCRIEAAMIEIMTPNDGSFSVKDTQTKAILERLCRAMGDPWDKIAIKLC